MVPIKPSAPGSVASSLQLLPSSPRSWDGAQGWLRGQRCPWPCPVGTCPHGTGAHGARQTSVKTTDTGLLIATNSPRMATNRLPGEFKAPRSCRVAPCRGGGSSLSSLVPFPCLPVSLLPGSHLAPPRQSSPFVWSQGRGQAAKGARGPSCSPPGQQCQGTLRMAALGVLPAPNRGGLGNPPEQCRVKKRPLV